ncbi:ATP-binding cassette domain-containing protein [Companilactobacillus halodurans]|uniref:ATP-binding cassette domain-containing protein n=1 Tax=Companilactobacillus halodurans TaxID=2584183 RepID=A0A5P0ZP92_9LACO|nr:ATP-binding cassette domain-containing protein [Companilactobacillus halodurans]MQS76028.1 ATP-binding cassette domain-containing protein [Companilactobacillus halodurans]MQS96464.1 ATP-binding cassette domain-containing protein [Companilactobacillus halodurans]
MKLISLNDLSLKTEGYFAFKHVAFSLSQKEIIGINGDNGSGKTLLLEAISDRITPDSGELMYTPGVRIGYLPQENPQQIDQSVKKYLEETRRLSKKLAVRTDQLQGMITFLGLTPYLDRPVSQLSIGLRRRIDFLATLAGHPNVLLLDEPFVFQTKQTISQMLKLLQDLKDNGSGIIIAATNFDDSVQQYLDNGYLIKDNALQQIPYFQQKEQCRLLFRINPNSSAITKDLEKYVTENINDMVELTIPLALKGSLITKMERLNYHFEGVESSEN